MYMTVQACLDLTWGRTDQMTSGASQYVRADTSDDCLELGFPNTYLLPT